MIKTIKITLLNDVKINEFMAAYTGPDNGSKTVTVADYGSNVSTCTGMRFVKKPAYKENFEHQIIFLYTMIDDELIVATSLVDIGKIIEKRHKRKLKKEQKENACREESNRGG